ncbi:MAG: hypothetical protein ACYDBP_04295 [Leptospirales bacterium]
MNPTERPENGSEKTEEISRRLDEFSKSLADLTRAIDESFSYGPFIEQLKRSIREIASDINERFSRGNLLGVSLGTAMLDRTFKDNKAYLTWDSAQVPVAEQCFRSLGRLIETVRDENMKPKSRKDLDHYDCFVMGADLKRAMNALGIDDPAATGGIVIPRGNLTASSCARSYEVWLTHDSDPWLLSGRFQCVGEFPLRPGCQHVELPKIVSIANVYPRSCTNYEDVYEEFAPEIRARLGPHHIGNFVGADGQRFAIYQARGGDGTIDRLESVETQFFHYAQESHSKDGCLWKIYQGIVRDLDRKIEAGKSRDASTLFDEGQASKPLRKRR